ncbi:phospholipase D-like domain-containing protein [Phormidesmis sp. 146-35]
MSKDSWSEIHGSMSVFRAELKAQLDNLISELLTSSDLLKSTELRAKILEFSSQFEDILQRQLESFSRKTRLSTLPEYELVFDREGSRKTLGEALSESKKRLIIVCPWLTLWGITDQEIQKFEELLENGVSISIGWGRSKELKNPRKQNLFWYAALPKLLELEKRHPHKFKLKAIGTHEKFLVCDEKFAFLGSHNILTSSEKSMTKADREVGIFTTSDQIIQSLVERFDDAPSLEIASMTQIAVTKEDRDQLLLEVSSECEISEEEFDAFFDKVLEMDEEEIDKLFESKTGQAILDRLIEEAENLPDEEAEELDDVSDIAPESEILEDGFFCTTFSPNGKAIASCSSNQTIKVWNTANKALLHTLNGNSKGINSIVFSPDHKIIASGGDDNVIRAWDLGTGQLLYTANARLRGVTSLAFSPNSQVLASAGHRSIRLWNSNTGELIKSFQADSSWISSISFSPDGRTLLSSSTNGFNRVVKLWNWTVGELIHVVTLTHLDAAFGKAFSTDWQTLASGADDSTVKLWDLQTGELLHTFFSSQRGIVSLAFSPDGQTLASGGKLGTIKLWNLNRKELTHTLSGHFALDAYFPNWVNSIAFSPDGTKLVSSGCDKTIKIWNILDLYDCGS